MLREKFKEMKRIQMEDIPLIDTEANSPKFTFSEAQRSGSLHIMSNKILQEEHNKIMREFKNTSTQNNTLFSVSKHMNQNVMPTIHVTNDLGNRSMYSQIGEANTFKKRNSKFEINKTLRDFPLQIKFETLQRKKAFQR